MALMMLFIGSGCNMDYRSKDDGGGSSSTADEGKRLSSILYLKSSDIDVKSELITNKSDESVIALSAGEYDYMHYKFTKSGGSSSDLSDSTGINAAVLAKDGAILTLRGSIVYSSGDHAHGVFSYGSGTNVTVSDCVVTTRGNNSGALITSSGGAMQAKHVTAETYGSSSPAMYVRRGGGAIAAERGQYTTAGSNSPVIRSEGEISVTSAKLETLSSQAVIMRGESSVTLASCDISANHTAQNNTDFSRYQAVLMYLDDNSDPTSNTESFTMISGSLLNSKGDVFYVTNTCATINLNDADIANAETDGALLRAEASQWGVSGANGGHVELILSNQDIEGNICIDDLSDMNMYLNDGSYFIGAVNADNTDARIYVEIAGAKWLLTADSYIDELTCEENSINLNGHNLYVAGAAYESGTESTGSAIDFASVRTQEIITPKISQDVSQDVSQDISGDETQDSQDGTQDTSADISGETETNPLSFDTLIYNTGTVNGVAYRAYNNRVYVSNPVSADYQSLSVYIPEPYFSSRPVNGYMPDTAPIFIPNNSSGYMAAGIMTPSDTNIIGLALSRGLVVVSPALRGRNITGGTAPAAIVDYKAAVRYLRANKSRLPAGNTDKIISCGVSSGGALSAILGASGNHGDYEYWLYELGAAEENDNIYAAVCYCPVTNLENADSAYEWTFGGSKYGEDSAYLAEEFSYYVNGLSLTKNDTALEIYDMNDPDYDEYQTFLAYINGLYADAAQNAIDSGTVISADWVKVSGNTVISADMRKYAESFSVRQKGVPAFDKFDLSSAENALFGYTHFTSYSSENSTAGGEMADTAAISAMNPMEYIGFSDTAKFWRIRHGVNDRDITLTIPAILALSLENSGCTVDFSAVWGQGHGGYYDTAELFDWIDSICK